MSGIRYFITALLLIVNYSVAPKPAGRLPILPDLSRVQTVKISVVGDLMAHSWQLDNAYNKATDTYDFNYSFKYIRKYLSGADLTIGNFEAVVGGKELGYSDFPRFNVPDAFAAAVKNAGFDLLTTANNHCNDKWEKGILRTIDVLDGLGIDHVGTYKSQEKRDTILIKEINGMKFAFLSYTYGTNGLALTEGKPYLANVMSEQLIKADIEKAKAQNPDFIVVLPHMGNEYATAPNQIFENWINMMFQAGADIVLASHPHVLQRAEYVNITNGDGTTRTGFVAYSLGNFVSSQRTTPRDAGIIMNLYFERVKGEKAILKNASYIPTWVKFYNAKGQYDITVLSVYDTLTNHSLGKNVDLREKDIARLKAVHSEIAKTFLDKQIPLTEIKNEYFIEKN